MSVGAEVGEYFECPRFIFEVAPISWSWSCCTCSRWCYTRQCFEGSSSGLNFQNCWNFATAPWIHCVNW